MGGAVERSETEGATAAGKTQADTALKDYQTRVADALQAGDYERAYALYREYRNPELRAFKDFYARKTFTEYADANGYGLRPDTAVGTENSLAAFEESYQNSVENTEKDSIIKLGKKDAVLNSAADPMADVFGAGEDSHPEEIARFKQLLKEYGVEHIEREAESLAYSPGLSSGMPGTIYVSKGASYSAWVHEMCHVEDDRAAGRLGMRVFGEPDTRYAWEVRAYGLEIDIALKAGRPDIADKLRDNLEQERRKIYVEDNY